MKILSIRQPWAWLIIYAGKDIENRSWWTNIRGRILVHAAKGLTRDEYELCLDFAHQVSRERRFSPGIVMPNRDELARGGVIGSVEITGVDAASFSPWFVGPYGFVLRDPHPLPFIPLRGRLGFFDAPPEVLAQIGGAL
jgi:hypothetical protein